MALKDILDRIETDAAAEAGALKAEARASAEGMVAAARQDADRARARTVADARTAAEREAATMTANARLRERDEMLSARQALAGEVLAAAETALVELPEGRYADMIAREAVAAAAGGEVARLASADAARLAEPLADALHAAGRDVRVSDVPADLDRGLLLEGDRTSVEVSPRAIIAARRDELLTLADGILFPRDAAPSGPAGEKE